VLLVIVTNLRQYSIVPIIYLVVGPGMSFVKMSALLLPVGSYAIWTMSLATTSRTKCYAIAFDFFFNVDSGTLVFFTTNILCTPTCAWPSMGIPIILNLYLSPLIISIPVFSAMNSDPNVEVSKPF
jgi:hypothetical protein